MITISRTEWRRDPSGWLRRADAEPVEIVGEDGRVSMVLTSSATPEVRGPWCVYCGAEPADEHGECADCRAWLAANPPNDMDAPDGPVCGCGRPSRLESGACSYECDGTPTGGSDAAQGLPPSPSRVAALPRAGVLTEPIDATAPAGTTPSAVLRTLQTPTPGAGPTDSEE